ncbi:MAG TPA: efflux RND transporter periplasmic adaptor subunit [Chloroflexota bacterium]|nr:efflux RND transporter periplasmic adaptor subunit [Chloroflexota bacterium]
MAELHRPMYRVAALLTAGAVILGGCELPIGARGLGNAAPEPTVAPSTSTSQTRPEATVRRGTVQDSIKVIGRVISSQEAELYFRTTNRLRGIFIETGQEVKAGQVLAEQETGDLVTRIGKARATLDNAQIAHDKARSKGVLDETADEVSSFDVAQINLSQAALQLEKLGGGPQDADIKGAEAGVAQAIAGLEKSRLDLATKEAQLAAKQVDLGYKFTGPSPDAIAVAQAELETRRISVQRSMQGPRIEDVQQSEIKLEQARTKLAQVRDAPPVKAEDVANAEIAVRAAEIKLEQSRSVATGTQAQREADIRTAELNVEIARNKQASIQNQQVNAWDVRLAEQAVLAAENDIARLRGPNPFDAQTARVAYDLAITKLEALQRPPSEQDLAQINNEINSLQLAVESARLAIPSSEAAVSAAQVKLEGVLRGTNEFDIREQQSKVEKAQLDVEKARAQLDIERQKLTATRAGTTFDLQSLQKDVEKAKLDLDQLEGNYSDARIVAPFDGKVTKVNGKSGDNVQAFNPVISLSSPANLLINAQIAESDMPKLAVGQRALISLDAFPGQTINGTVQTLPSSVVTQQGVVADKNTKITVEWTRPGAQLGMNARVQIVVQKKDDVLLIPTQAIRTVGKRRFVEYMDGTVKRSRNVEIGISTDVETEVVSGLDEGMPILAGS